MDLSDGIDEPANFKGYGRMAPFAVLVALAGYAFLFLCFRPHIFRVNADFVCFYRAGKMLDVGETANIYNLDAEKQYDHEWINQYAVPGEDLPTLPWVSPPFVLLIFGALARLSYAHAWIIWCAANVGMLFGIPLLLQNALGRGRLFALAVASPPFFLPLDFALLRGQMAILLAFLFAWMFAELAKGHTGRAGCILALITLKPQLAIPMFLALAFARNWKAIAAFFATCFGLFGVCVALVGWSVTLSYPRLLSQFNALPPELWGPAPQYFANVRGFLYVMLHARLSTLNLAALTFALSSALMLLVVVALRRRESLALGFALVIVVTLLTSYHAYLHDMSLLLPAFFLTGSYLRGRKLGRIELTLALVVYALFLTPIMCMVFRLGHIPIFLGMLLLAGVQFAALLDRPRKGRTELPSGPVSNSLAQF